MRPLKTLKKLYDEESHIVIQEKSSPPRVLFYGEDFLLEDVPVGITTTRKFGHYRQTVLQC